MLEGMTVKKGVGTKKKLEALAASDPEFAGIVQTMLTDYKKRTSQIAEDRKAIEKEKADLAAARRRMEDENERLRHAVFESGLGLPVQPAPGGEPEAIEEPDWGEVGVDPKAYAEAIRKQVKAEIMAELRGQMPEMLKPVTEPLGRFRESLQREQNKMNVDRIIGETRDWGVLKPEVDAFIVEENKRIEAGAQNYRTSLQNVINIVRGQRAAKVAELDEQRRRSEDTARFAGASAAGRGSGAKPPPVYTPEHRARGITGLREAHDAFIEQGYSEQEISDANPLGVR